MVIKHTHTTYGFLFFFFSRCVLEDELERLGVVVAGAALLSSEATSEPTSSDMERSITEAMKSIPTPVSRR